MLRDGPWANRPHRIDRTTIRRPTPEAYLTSLTSPTVEVMPLVTNVSAEFPSGWCTYSDALDSPETEVCCGGTNHKTPTAAAVWRQGHLLHFGFDLSPDEMNDRGHALLVNGIVYIARFTEDRPITHAPERALLRTSADRLMANKEPKKAYVEWYFPPAIRKQGKADAWPVFQTWYKQHRDYLRADRGHKGSMVLDEEAESFGVPPHRPDFFPAMIAALKTEDRLKAHLAGKLLRRYAPTGPAETKVEAWQSWWKENKSYVFFSESGWYQWYVDPLAKKRGVPTADLRGPARACRPTD